MIVSSLRMAAISMTLNGLPAAGASAAPVSPRTAGPCLPAGALQIELHITADNGRFAFLYRVGDGDWKTLVAGVDASILTDHAAGGFVGSYIGLFARDARARHGS